MAQNKGRSLAKETYSPFLSNFPTYIARTIKSPQQSRKFIKNIHITDLSRGFTLLELISVLAILSLLTTVSVTQISSLIRELEVDEIQAHLNKAAEECLRLYRNSSSSTSTPSPSVIDKALLEKNGYQQHKKYNKCGFFQLTPASNNSNYHYEIGFGIANNRVYKFGITTEEDSKGSCQRWAGEKCVANGKESFNKFFNYMESVRLARNTCELSFKKSIAKDPKQKLHLRWDTKHDENCGNLEPQPNNKSGYKKRCSKKLCNKKAYVHDGNFVGYTEANYDQAQSTSCSESINEFINGPDYDGESISKSDLKNCKQTIHICDYKQLDTKTELQACEIEIAKRSCTLDLEEQRKTATGEITVSGSGLPPCGRKFWICDQVIYDNKEAYDKFCSRGQ